MSARLTLLICLAAPFSENQVGSTDTPLATTDPLVCKQVRGFRDYDKRDPPELTSDEKLLIYFEPLHYTIGRTESGEKYRAHLVVDAILRRKGQKKPLLAEDRIIDYKPESTDPPTSLYLSATIALKGLSPGEYEVELLLKDGLASARMPVRKTIPFKIIPVRSGGGVQH